jgi:hypothetical protein
VVKKIKLIFVVAAFALMLAACGGNQAVTAAENYIKAFVGKDASRLLALSCAEWEPDAQLELDSVESVTMTLDGLSCAVTSTQDNTSLVKCQGKIIASYNNEDREFDLSLRPYKIINQGGESLMCGYQ